MSTMLCVAIGLFVAGCIVFLGAMEMKRLMRLVAKLEKELEERRKS